MRALDTVKVLITLVAVAGLVTTGCDKKKDAKGKDKAAEGKKVDKAEGKKDDKAAEGKKDDKAAEGKKDDKAAEGKKDDAAAKNPCAGKKDDAAAKNPCAGKKDDAAAKKDDAAAKNPCAGKKDDAAAKNPCAGKKDDAAAKKDDAAAKNPCAGKKDDAAAKKDDAAAKNPCAGKKADAKPAAAGDAPKAPPFALAVMHKVADYDKWKAEFDKHADARKKAGFLGEHVNRGADDKSLVTVFLPFADMAKAKAFAASPDLKKAMKASGVVGEPKVMWVKPQGGNVAMDTAKDKPAMIVIHEVADFAKWMEGFKKSEADRTKAGFTHWSVNSVVDKPNMVMVYLMGSDVAKMKAFGASPELKKAMAEAGVKGKPDITWVNAIGGHLYK